jgi:hypothetical protein
MKQSAATSSRLTGWVYWQRDPRRSPDCWTKVFAVLDNAFLWLSQHEESAPRSVLVQLAVASVEQDGAGLLRVTDSGGEELRLCLYDDAAFERWWSRLEEAADLTAAFFRSSGVFDAQDLPRWSNYRGTLEDYHRVSKRTRCKDAVTQMMARRWRMHQELKLEQGESASDPSALKDAK